jgi:phosphoribosylformylglycinamidine synthase
MAFRIEVKYEIPDARAKLKLGFFNSLGLSGKVRVVEILDCYSVDAKLSASDVKRAAELLTNKITEEYFIHPSLTLPIKGRESANSPPSVGGARGGGKRFFDNRWSWAIEISFLPGVTDNVGATAKETIEDGLGVYPHTKNRSHGFGVGVYSSQVYLLAGKINKSDAKKIASSLYNPLIQRALIKNSKELKKGFQPNLSKVRLKQKIAIQKINLNLPDAQLTDLGRLGIVDAKTKQRRGPLALGLDELKAIRNYFHKLGRKPTDVELESLAQTWSEHCKHTIFNDPLDEISDGIYRHYIKRATEIIRQRRNPHPALGVPQKSRKDFRGIPDLPHRGREKEGEDFCVSVFSDNSGAITFDKNYLVTHKVETHNTPSALDPFGGAITGIVGVNRDTLGFGLGAKPIINVYGFCLADPRDKSILFRSDPSVGNGRDRSLQDDGKMLSARRIMDGVIAGVNAGGNQSGIPTNSGFLYFDQRFRGKPLVFAGTVGLMPRQVAKRPGHVKFPKPGDLIVLVGGRTGLDGIHGATFSSETLSKDSPATAVQIGDPITQKKFSDALVKEARDLNLYSAITDNGAGGLSSSVGEMAKLTGGCEVHLHKVPAKYLGLQPWQIWISESQERMTLAVPPASWKKLENLMKRRGCQAAVIGRFTNSGKCAVKYKNQTVMDVDLEFLHEGRPIRYQVSGIRYQGETSPIPSLQRRGAPSEVEGRGGQIFNLKSLILNLLRRPNIASTEFVSMQYDHEVQGSSITKPLQGLGRVCAEATITRPILNSQKGVVLANGLTPAYSDFDTYHMAASAIDSAVRAAVCAGANLSHLALLDNFCWYSGNEPESLYKLKMAAKACFDYAVSYGMPFISGKDSMFNDFKGFDDVGKQIKISIPPTLLISAISVMDDIAKAMTIDLKCAGDLIYVLGETKNELAGSEYLKMISPPAKEGGTACGGVVPKVDAKKNLKLYQALQKTINDGLIASAISIGRGGLGMALCKTALAGNLGINIDINRVPAKIKNIETLLFSETQGRILVSVDPKKAKQFEKLLRGNRYARIGVVSDDNLITIRKAKNQLAQFKVADAAKAYKSTFKQY